MKNKSNQSKNLKLDASTMYVCLYFNYFIIIMFLHVQTKTHVMKERNLARENEQRFYEINSLGFNVNKLI